MRAMLPYGLTPSLTRRGFVFGASLTAGGLALGLRPALSQPDAARAAAAASEVTVWIAIGPDDTVHIRVARSEMGQGIATALPMLVAEELDCDWARVRPDFFGADTNLARGRPWGDMVTSASVSVRASHDYLRRAGAQARQMLIAEAAARWSVEPGECVARDGIISHGASGRTLRYGELAAAASRRPVPRDVSLKKPEEWRLLGKRIRAIDTPAKVTGEPIYATDVRLPDMLYAAVKACPAHGGKLKSFEAGPALAMEGVRHVVPVGQTAVAVVATRWWQAAKALDALPVIWDETPSATLSTDTLREQFRQGLDHPNPIEGYRKGDVDAALSSAAKRIEREYDVPYLAHATMEPQTCTAHVTAERAEVWAPTQNAEGTLMVVAATLGIDREKVIVHKCHLGGGFGRRGLAQDWARQAVLIAKAVGQPVKMIWTREEDLQQDFYRPMCVARHSAGFDRSGVLIGWKVRLCGSSVAAQLAPQWLRGGRDMMLMEGFHEGDMPYAIPNFQASCVMHNTSIPVGFWRGVNLSQNGFFREAFVDEMAEAAGQDPYLFRRALLRDAPRSLAVLDEVARRANWGAAPTGSHQGMALVECHNSVCAQVVEIARTRGGAVDVRRVVCVVDPGYVVNPAICEAQIEGAIVQALSAARSGEMTFKSGRAEQSNFHDYLFTRMNEAPRVEVYLLPSGGAYRAGWGGIGETGVPPAAPALVNAIFAATGTRVRSLPLKNHSFQPAR
jgi:isoquinoline 1-oxidoreductase beta subunit